MNETHTPIDATDENPAVRCKGCYFGRGEHMAGCQYAQTGADLAGHTAGPWKLHYYTDENGVEGQDCRLYESDLPKRIVTCKFPYGDKANANANARLIAAAPALLAERDALRAEVAELRGALEDVEKRARREGKWEAWRKAAKRLTDHENAHKA